MEKEQHKEYWKPSVTADIVAINSAPAMYREDGAFINIVLIKRAETSEAYPNCWALPGGFLDKGESIEACAIRELKEETGLDARMLVPVGTFSRPDRDPRGQVISNAFFSLFLSSKEEPLPLKAGDDARGIALFRLKGNFNKSDGSLSVNLHSPKLRQTILFTASFYRDQYGLLKTEINCESENKLAFDHAEIIARTILKAPDLVLPTTDKTNVSAKEDSDSESLPDDQKNN